MFVLDRATNAIELASASGFGFPQDRGLPNGALPTAGISANGRYVAFDSAARNLVGRDRNRRTDVFVRDRTLNSTRLVSRSSGGRQGTGGDSLRPAISADGRYVAFVSSARGLVRGVPRGWHVYVRDLRRGTTRIADVTSGGTFGARAGGPLQRPALDRSGKLVVFASGAARLVGDDDNGAADAFLRRLRG